MQNNGIEMLVLVNGRNVKEYTHQGMSFIEARNGTNYTIKLKNNTGYRVMTVVSVDGLDVVSGKNAAETDTGYILDAYGSTEIKGYRLSDNDSAAFVFTSKGKSYVQSVKSDARNCGVIGVRAFNEKLTSPWYGTYTVPMVYTTPSTHTITNLNYTMPQTYTMDSNPTIYSMAVNASNTAQPTVDNSRNILKSVTTTSTTATSIPVSMDYTNFDTGTGWGQKQEDKVTRVSFEKGSLLGELTMYYASEDALKEMGVDMSSKKKLGMPQAFDGYCKPPKGWNG
jgi:hypothetical protein